MFHVKHLATICWKRNVKHFSACVKHIKRALYIRKKQIIYKQNTDKRKSHKKNKKTNKRQGASKTQSGVKRHNTINVQTQKEIPIQEDEIKLNRKHQIKKH